MKGICLLSQGIDSPVAAYIMSRKGIEVTGLNFFAESPGPGNVIRLLAKKAGIKKLIAADIRPFQGSIGGTGRQRCVLCKRFMYRAAEMLLKKEKADFIITGENLGQVASQTLSNMAVISSSVKCIVLRPLLCYDKNEIIRVAREISTYSLSTENNPRCRFVPKMPATRASPKDIELIESKLEIAGKLEKALKGAERLVI